MTLGEPEPRTAEGEVVAQLLGEGVAEALAVGERLAPTVVVGSGEAVESAERDLEAVGEVQPLGETLPRGVLEAGALGVVQAVVAALREGEGESDASLGCVRETVGVAEAWAGVGVAADDCSALRVPLPPVALPLGEVEGGAVDEVEWEMEVVGCSVGAEDALPVALGCCAVADTSGVADAVEQSVARGVAVGSAWVADSSGDENGLPEPLELSVAAAVAEEDCAGERESEGERESVADALAQRDTAGEPESVPEALAQRVVEGEPDSAAEALAQREEDGEPVAVRAAVRLAGSPVAEARCGEGEAVAVPCAAKSGVTLIPLLRLPVGVGAALLAEARGEVVSRPGEGVAVAQALEGALPDAAATVGDKEVHADTEAEAASLPEAGAPERVATGLLDGCGLALPPPPAVADADAHTVLLPVPQPDTAPLALPRGVGVNTEVVLTVPHPLPLRLALAHPLPLTDSVPVGVAEELTVGRWVETADRVRVGVVKGEVENEWLGVPVCVTVWSATVAELHTVGGGEGVALGVPEVQPLRVGVEEAAELAEAQGVTEEVEVGGGVLVVVAVEQRETRALNEAVPVCGVEALREGEPETEPVGVGAAVAVGLPEMLLDLGGEALAEGQDEGEDELKGLREVEGETRMLGEARPLPDMELLPLTLPLSLLVGENAALVLGEAELELRPEAEREGAPVREADGQGVNERVKIGEGEGVEYTLALGVANALPEVDKLFVPEEQSLREGVRAALSLGKGELVALWLGDPLAATLREAERLREGQPVAVAQIEGVVECESPPAPPLARVLALAHPDALPVTLTLALTDGERERGALGELLGDWVRLRVGRGEAEPLPLCVGLRLDAEDREGEWLLLPLRVALTQPEVLADLKGEPDMDALAVLVRVGSGVPVGEVEERAEPLLETDGGGLRDTLPLFDLRGDAEVRSEPLDEAETEGDGRVERELLAEWDTEPVGRAVRELLRQAVTLAEREGEAVYEGEAEGVAVVH